MATKSQEILLKGNTTNASAVPSSLKVREIAINALDRSLFTNDGNSIVKLYTGTNKWFDVNGNANNALKLGGILASEYINKEAFNSHINNSVIHITANERTAWNNKWDYNEETIKAVKVNAAVNADKLATARKIWGKPFDGSADVSGDLINVGNITASGKATIQGDIISGGEVAAIVGEGTPAGVTDYSALTSKPQINGVTLLSGNNTLVSLGIQPAGDYATNSGVATLLADYAKKTFVANNYAGKAAFNNHTGNTDIHITAAERDAWNAKWDYNEATIKAVKVTSASSADSVAWSGISGKPTSLKNPYALTFGSKTYNGSAAATITASDLGALTSITKSMVEGVLTGNITSHTHSQYLTSALRPAKLFVRKERFPRGYFIIKINNNSEWILSFDVKIVVPDGSYTIRFSEDNSTESEFWHSPSASMIDGEDSIEVKFGYRRPNKWVAIPAPHSLVGISITNVANGYAPIDTYDLDKLFTIEFFEGDASDLEYLGTVQETITIYPPSKEGHTHTFASLTSKPTTINGYGITDALTTSNYNSYVPTRTGTGASGTWGISITGNAATATNAPWSGITGKPTTFTPSAHTHTANEISGLPTALKNPYALTFGTKTYDGSAAATITASDLGALTAHQTIYALTLQVNGTSKEVYNPASATKTINIAVPTKTSDITNDSGFITSASIPTALKNPYAVEIKANGVSLGTYDGSKAATFNLSAANVGAANKVHTHTASDISGLPTKLSAFTNDVGYITGITKSMVEGVLTGDITSHTHTFASLTSKPTTIAGYGITDALTSSTKYALADAAGGRALKMYVTSCSYNNNSKAWDDATIYPLSVRFWDVYDDGGPNKYGDILEINGGNGHWKPQLWFDAGTGQMRVRNKNYNTAHFNDWRLILDNINYLSYTYSQSAIDSKLSGYLPLSGGTITGPLIKRETGQNFITFQDSNGNTYGYLGFNGANTPIYIPKEANAIYTLIHSGNYNSYAPTLTGKGASGTWGISISGNAAMAKHLKLGQGAIAATERGDYDYTHALYTGGWDGSNLGYASAYGTFIDLSGYATWYHRLAFNTTGEIEHFIGINTTTLSKVGSLAYLTSNVASATKLQTPRTIWGNSFDGTGDVWGQIIIKASSGLYHQDSNGNYLAYVGGDLNGGYVHLYNFANGNSIQLYNDGRVSIPKGNILIGTTTDNGYRLQVNGSERVYGDLIVDGEVSALVA